MRQRNCGRRTNVFAVSLLSLLANIFSANAAQIVITEIAYRGSGEDTCNGEDWIELHNTFDDESVVDMTGWKVYDDKGSDDEDANLTLTLPPLSPGDYVVLCKDTDFAFGIGSDDTITLLDAGGVVVDFVSMAEQGGGDPESTTYALTAVNNEFGYTTTATPGLPNVVTESVPLMDRLRAREALGDDFFSMSGDDSSSSSSNYDTVIDIDLSINPESLQIITDHPAWEEWVDFEGLAVSTRDGNGLASSTGSIRVKGQSTNTIPTCLGVPNVPLNIKFDTPFLGMDQLYLRNHYGDPSYMRDIAAHKMMKAMGLPYLRTRIARVHINGGYLGLFIVMEAPNSGYVLQRSFGDFDPDKTAIFKAKTFIDNCPFGGTNGIPIFSGDADPDSPVPDPYYFERGSHRDETPVLGDVILCQGFFFAQITKEQSDVARGVYEYDEKCGRAMVGLGRVDRDYGPKRTEDKMIDFLDGYFYNKDVDDFTGAVDMDSWLKNLAFMAVTLHFDSPIGLINNWYMATTNGGEGDWKILQYDHNSFMSHTIASLTCSAECGPRMAYWPIMQPTCGPVGEHRIVGRILNSPENMEKYLSYAQEMVDLLTEEGGVMAEMYAYGNVIKEHVMEDPLNSLSMEEYEDKELGEDIDSYNDGEPPFLKFLRVRVGEVQKQLEAIKKGTLPRNGDYDPEAFCPDWRDEGSGVVVTAATPSEDCPIPDCLQKTMCFSNAFCGPDGKMLIPECAAASPFCDTCFPHSRCGSATDIDVSGTFVASEDCGDDLAACVAATGCFDNTSGRCSFDGSLLTEECKDAELVCTPCFPYSRCGSGDPPAVVPVAPTGSGVFTPNAMTCGLAFGECAEAGPCFDHDMGLCAEDGTITNEMCQQALLCAPCFPNSRCGTAEEGAVAEDEGEESEQKEEVPAEGPVEDEEEEDEASTMEATTSGATTTITTTLVSKVLLVLLVAGLSW